MAEVFDFGLQQHKIKMDGKFSENNLFAVAGDTGRRLEVQLLDSNNMVQNTTGISLRLNANVAGQATYAEATLVDATKGLYELNLPNGMLIAPGNWQFQWQIIGTSGEKLHSFAFTGSVGSNLSEGGTEATNFYLNVDELKQMQDDLINGTFDSEVLETNIAEKLNNLEEQYAPKLVEVTAQLAQTGNDLAVKIDRGDVSVSDIDKNKGLLDETFFTEGVKQQWAGNTPISAIPADNSITNKKLTKKSVRKENTNFINMSSNLFPKDEVEIGFAIDPVTGALTPNSVYATNKDIQSVVAGEQIVFVKSNERSSRYAFYNGKAVVSSDTVVRTETHKVVTVPAGADGWRYAVQIDDLNVAQVNNGNLLLPYEPYISPRLDVINPALETNNIEIVYTNGILTGVKEGDKTTVLQYTNGILTGYTEATVRKNVQSSMVYDNNKLIAVEREVL